MSRNQKSRQDCFKVGVSNQQRWVGRRWGSELFDAVSDCTSSMKGYASIGWKAPVISQDQVPRFPCCSAKFPTMQVQSSAKAADSCAGLFTFGDLKQESDCVWKHRSECHP